MFPSDIGGIMPDQTIQGTCAVCGDPIDGLVFGVGLPLPLGKVDKCKQCGKAVCSKHYSKSREKCVTCETGRDSWCKTPDIPKI